MPIARQIATRHLGFGIPFSIDDPKNEFIEVQLFLSKDRGQTWQMYARQNTTAREFPFQASGDGEYWFAIRTLDRNRQLLPAGQMRVELKVIVDTRKPELDLRVQTDSAGRIVCRWRGEDPNIDAHSVLISYRPLISIDDRENVWIPVPYRPLTEPINGVFADQYAWWMESGANEVLVRLQISDLAGNQTTEERQIVAPRVTMKSGQLALAMPSQPPTDSAIATNQTRGTIEPADNLPNARQQSPPLHNEIGNGRDSSTKVPAQVVSLMDQTGNWPPSNDATKLPPPAYGTLPEREHPGSAAGNSATGDSAVPRNAIPWESNRTHSDGLNHSVGSTWPQTPTTAPLLFSGHNQGESLSALTHRASLPDVSNSNTDIPKPLIPYERLADTTQPTSERTTLQNPTPPIGFASNRVESQPQQHTDSYRMIEVINSRRFRLNYDLGGLHPDDIKSVVLWYTADGGQTWTSYGEDPDRQSPFPVEMAGQGTYGFRIVFHTFSGLSGRAPARGDDADVWISIDLTPPVAALTSAPYGRGEFAGHLMIHWQAVDENLRIRPITLAYSTLPTGPWTTITEGLENTGTYAWKIGSEVPDQVYLQLTVVDAGGNVTTNQTTDPIDLRALIPRGRILGVQPVR